MRVANPGPVRERTEVQCEFIISIRDVQVKMEASGSVDISSMYSVVVVELSLTSDEIENLTLTS